MSSTFSSQMSREDQVNLNSYANTFIRSKFSFQDSNTSGIPMSNPSQKASTGFYLILVLRSSLFKVGGYCHNHKECPSSIGVVAIPTWGQMANLAPSGALWNFWPYHYSLAFYGPRPYPAIIGLPGHFPYPQHPGLYLCVGPGGSGSSRPHHGFWANPFH
ncbi:hypothetical protein O181_079981 [Austropuccinia psidii MF-1]|uniref:Uncharacterized protein n=1 Tax=Austropuccinia psidii MF-1 TaxID=1389203 RepID=A0A9Q3IEH7_9BASI|nr:hypothetical protein [Austropuccinia psidii MF-1]